VGKVRKLPVSPFYWRRERDALPAKEARSNERLPPDLLTAEGRLHASRTTALRV